jgi:DNA modification methylase
MIQLYNGDCLELMKNIPDGSVDLVLTDPPYGTTACKWDSVIPFEPMWEELKRIVKRGGAIVLFGSEPFSSLLRASNIDWYKYDWIWEKEQSSSGLQANIAPMKKHENISVFFQAPTDDTTNAYKKLKQYFQNEKKKSGLSSKQIRELLGNYMSSHYFTNGEQFCIPSICDYEKLQTTGFFCLPYEEIKKEYEKAKNTYNPQMTEGKAYKGHFAPGAEVHGKSTHYVKENKGTRYPTSILKFNRARGLHPTQKPVDLLEYLIKTYTNESETVLDFTMGSGSTGVACINTNRKFIGIELDENYFNIAKDRIENSIKNK